MKFKHKLRPLSRKTGRIDALGNKINRVFHQIYLPLGSLTFLTDFQALTSSRNFALMDVPRPSPSDSFRFIYKTATPLSEGQSGVEELLEIMHALSVPNHKRSSQVVRSPEYSSQRLRRIYNDQRLRDPALAGPFNYDPIPSHLPPGSMPIRRMRTLRAKWIEGLEDAHHRDPTRKLEDYRRRLAHALEYEIRLEQNTPHDMFAPNSPPPSPDTHLYLFPFLDAQRNRLRFPPPAELEILSRTWGSHNLHDVLWTLTKLKVREARRFGATPAQCLELLTSMGQGIVNMFPSGYIEGITDEIDVAAGADDWDSESESVSE